MEVSKNLAHYQKLIRQAFPKLSEHEYVSLTAWLVSFPAQQDIIRTEHTSSDSFYCLLAPGLVVEIFNDGTAMVLFDTPKSRNHFHDFTYSDLPTMWEVLAKKGHVFAPEQKYIYPA